MSRSGSNRAWAVYAAALAGNVVAVAGFTVLAARRAGGPVITVPNLLTLSRAGAAASLCAAAFSGRGTRVAWSALLLGCTAADWLDGPLARRLGPTRLGAVLDVETDSWLTLWAAIAANRMGRVGALTLLPPVLRYPLALRRTGPPKGWQRAAGVAQMVALCAALAPWRPARLTGRLLAPLASTAQLLALVSCSGSSSSTPPCAEVCGVSTGR